MADETGLVLAETGEQDPDASRFWKNDPATVPEHYINRHVISEGASEVTLALGVKYPERGHRRDLCRVRLVMSHDQFLEFAEDVRKEAEFLQRLYNGRPTSLRGVSLDQYNKAVGDVYGHDFPSPDYPPEDDENYS